MEYIVDESTLRKLQSIKKRLYAPAPLTPDERRDLANAMDAILHQDFIAIPEDSVKP